MTQLFTRRNLISLLSLIFSLVLLTGMSSVRAAAEGVSYQGHVENIGWEEAVQDGDQSGTVGRGLKLEALKIELIDPENLGIEYRAHVQDIGWQDFSADGELAGTEGQNKRLEAIEIHLTGDDAVNYSIWYRVHAQDYGWLGWASNGQSAGTENQSKRLEAIEIILLPRDAEAPGSTEQRFIKLEDQKTDLGAMYAQTGSGIDYRAYMSGTGWTGYVTNGTVLGGDSGKIDVVQIDLSEENYARGGIVYRTLNDGYGWTDWTINNSECGVPGSGIQAIRIKLSTQLPYLYDIYYRVFVPGIGWSNFARNGEPAGSEGYGRNISAIQIYLGEKGAQPGPVGNAFAQTSWFWPTPGYTGINSYFGPRNSTHHDGIDVGAPGGAPIGSAKAGTVILAGWAGNFGNCVAVEHDSGEVVYYAHMSSIASSVGQKVAQGQLLGYVGTTGNSLGNHLHMEMYTSGDELVNPLNYY